MPSVCSRMMHYGGASIAIASTFDQQVSGKRLTSVHHRTGTPVHKVLQFFLISFILFSVTSCGRKVKPQPDPVMKHRPRSERWVHQFWGVVVYWWCTGVWSLWGSLSCIKFHSNKLHPLSISFFLGSLFFNSHASGRRLFAWCSAVHTHTWRVKWLFSWRTTRKRDGIATTRQRQQQQWKRRQLQQNEAEGKPSIHPI